MFGGDTIPGRGEEGAKQPCVAPTRAAGLGDEVGDSIPGELLATQDLKRSTRSLLLRQLGIITNNCAEGTVPGTRQTGVDHGCPYTV